MSSRAVFSLALPPGSRRVCAAAALVAFALPAVAQTKAKPNTNAVMPTSPTIATAVVAEKIGSNSGQPNAVAAWEDGAFLYADGAAGKVYRVLPDGTRSVVAGSYLQGYAGDGGPATKAQLKSPTDISPTDDGGFLIADTGNHRIRRVGPDGKITTVAGTGVAGYAQSEDGGPATSAKLKNPRAVAALPGGAFLIADTGNSRIRKVSKSGKISSLDGFGAYGGTQLGSPLALTVLPDGAILIADHDRNRILRWKGGVASVAAGTGALGLTPDGVDATQATFFGVADVASTGDGGYLVVDQNNHRIYRVGTDGKIARVAGKGVGCCYGAGQPTSPTDEGGFSGDGGPAVEAELSKPQAVCATGNGGYLIADTRNHRVRRVTHHDANQLVPTGPIQVDPLQGVPQQPSPTRAPARR
jgi:hypothetical protein